MYRKASDPHEYIVINIKGNTPDNCLTPIGTVVTTFLSRGWKLYGSPMITKEGEVLQAMTRTLRARLDDKEDWESKSTDWGSVYSPKLSNNDE